MLQPASARKSGIYHDQIMTPVDPTLHPVLGDIPAGYRPRSLMRLTQALWHGTANFGHAPLHFITQRGPFQNGVTPTDMRYDIRTVQVIVGEAVCNPTEWMDKRWDVLDLLRPNRSFSTAGVPRPLIYRRWLPDGEIESGNDLVTTLGSAIVTSHDGRFFDRGGLDVGARFTITTGADVANYTIVAVPNDYTLTLSANMGATATDIGWEYRRAWSKRDLFCLLEAGPTFNEGPGAQPFTPLGYREALRFVAHDPFWYGLEQVETWELEVDLDELRFDLASDGAYMVAGAAGEWFFAVSSFTETTDVVYWGTEGAKPVFTITGPFSFISIRNDSIDVELELNYTAALGEVVTIDVLNLTVTNAAGDNLLQFLTGDLATWEISPDPQAPDRINEITAQLVGGGPGVSGIVMTYKNRYVGI